MLKCKAKDHNEIKLWLTTATCDLVERYLPVNVARRIKWGVYGDGKRTDQCGLDCDAKDKVTIIATAQQHFPNSVPEIKEAFCNSKPN